MRRAITLAVLLAACSSERDPPNPPANNDAGTQNDAAPNEDASTPDSGAEEDAGPQPIPLNAEPQRQGDPAAGYNALVNFGYVGCGVPYSAYSIAMGQAPDALKIPGRTGRNADLPYFQTAFTTTSSVEVVMANCLSCHADQLNGEVVIGMPNSRQDFTNNPSDAAELAGFLINDPAERAEWRKWADRVRAIGPYIQASVIGSNPADNLAAALFAHRDPKTLAWSEEPLLELPPTFVVPVDVPPWWRMKKKNAMFYVGGGRGDHARIMMTASTLCVDNVPEAQAIDRWFGDVRAYIASIEAPAYPLPIDQAKADRGKMVFETNCTRCHGTYGENESYPNLLIPAESVGTDPVLALGAAQYTERFIDWFNRSFYGETARLEPQTGYVAPPLDGIWATAPYLHNGSVPTLAALLESSTRPQFWSRTYGTNLTDFDQAAVGWKTTVVDHGHADEPNIAQRKRIFDTTLLGHSNMGHLYGDPLSADDRSALIEYLKTL